MKLFCHDDRKYSSAAAIPLFFLPLLLLPFLCSCAAPVKSAEHPATDTIYALIAAENDEDWDAYVDLWCQSEQDSYAQLVQNNDKQTSHTGIFNVKSAAVKEVTELPLEEVSPYLLNFDDYESMYGTLAAFLVDVDYQVYREDKYHTNGVNCRLALLGTEDGARRIVEWSAAPPALATP